MFGCGCVGVQLGFDFGKVFECLIFVVVVFFVGGELVGLVIDLMYQEVVWFVEVVQFDCFVIDVGECDQFIDDGEGNVVFVGYLIEWWLVLDFFVV